MSEVATDVFAYREEWLHKAADLMYPWFEELGVECPQVRISCGWAKRAGANAIGWTFHKNSSSDDMNQIYISPEMDDPIKILATLLHEMVHASDDGASKHSGHFKTTATKLGLEGKMTATYPGEVLTSKLSCISTKLGNYPHAKIVPVTRVGKQGTRMIKIVCGDLACGYTVRSTRKWIDLGLPTCFCGSEMSESV